MTHIPGDWFDRPLPANVRIGEGSHVYSSYAFLHHRSEQPCAVQIGRASGVYAGSFFELGPQGEVRIGDYSTLVGAIIATNGLVLIGSYAFLAHEVVIADHFAVTPRKHDAPPTPANQDPCVVLGDDVWIGAGAILLKGARIGAGSIVGAGAVVDFEVPPNAIVAGNPARIMGHADD